MILKLTNVYETSHQDFQYDPCVVLADGHGFSAGIIQFTTGTGSAGKVIELYTQKASPNEFTPFNASLARIAAKLAASPGSLVSSTDGLEGFCAAWQAASSKDAFRSAQVEALVRMYLAPAQALAQSAGVTLAATIGQIYDSCIQLGEQGTRELVQSVTARAGRPSPSTEHAWLDEFLNAREDKLTSMGGAYAPTVTRVRSYRMLSSSGDLNMSQPPVQALNNDGAPMAVDCSPPIALPDVGLPAARPAVDGGRPYSGGRIADAAAWMAGVAIAAVLMW